MRDKWVFTKKEMDEAVASGVFKKSEFRRENGRYKLRHEE